MRTYSQTHLHTHNYKEWNQLEYGFLARKGRKKRGREEKENDKERRAKGEEERREGEKEKEEGEKANSLPPHPHIITQGRHGHLCGRLIS